MPCEGVTPPLMDTVLLALRSMGAAWTGSFMTSPLTFWLSRDDQPGYAPNLGAQQAAFPQRG
jgi:hypothetical protein